MFRFTIREFILLTTMAAVGCGWWLDHVYQTARHHPDAWQIRSGIVEHLLEEKLGWFATWTDDGLLMRDFRGGAPSRRIRFGEHIRFLLNEADPIGRRPTPASSRTTDPWAILPWACIWIASYLVALALTPGILRVWQKRMAMCTNRRDITREAAGW